MPPTLPPHLQIHHSPSNPNHRSLHTTTPFPNPGTTIATFPSPLLALPSGATTHTTCNYCLRPGSSPGDVKLRACTACRIAVYCSPACQRSHWRSGEHKAECAMFARVREKAGKDWLPTAVRGVAQVLMRWRAGDEKVREAFFSGGGAGGSEWGLEGNVEGFRKDGEEVWRDLELQGAAAVVYAELVGEGEGVLERARDVLCKVGCLVLRVEDGLADEDRSKRMRSTGWMPMRAWRGFSWTLAWPWSITRVCPTRLLGLRGGRLC